MVRVLFLVMLLVGCWTSRPPAPPPPSNSPPESIPPELACRIDSDCAWGDLAIEVATPDECDCPRCNAALVNVTTARIRRSAWSQHCKLENHVLNDRKVCAISDCLYIRLSCQQGRCAERPAR